MSGGRVIGTRNQRSVPSARVPIGIRKKRGFLNLKVFEMARCPWLNQFQSDKGECTFGDCDGEVFIVKIKDGDCVHHSECGDD